MGTLSSLRLPCLVLAAAAAAGAAFAGTSSLPEVKSFVRSANNCQRLALDKHAKDEQDSPSYGRDLFAAVLAVLESNKDVRLEGAIDQVRAECRQHRGGLQASSSFGTAK